MDNFDLKKYLAEGKLQEQVYNAFDGNPEVEKTLDGISDLTTKLRGLGNEAYGGEKRMYILVRLEMHLKHLIKPLWI